ncbi:MAG: hypothetical protein WCE49_16145 [Terrimicrobiaceae bacterium]
MARRRFVPVFAAVMGESVLLVIILHAIEVEIIGIKPPQVVNGFNQDPIDGVSFVSTFADSKAPEVKKTQYFDNNGSRGIYQDGWYACTFGPLVPWLPGAPALADWDANKAQTEAIPAAGRSDKKSGANGAKISKLWGGLMGGDAHLMAGFCQEMIVFGAAFFSARFVAIGAVGHMIGGDNFEH